MHDLIVAAKAQRRSQPDTLTFQYFSAEDGTCLRYCIWPPQKNGFVRGTVIFLPGRTEFIEKFYEDMRIMRGLGFASAAMDLRGQGLSDRPYGDRDKHELDSFDPHISDVGQLVDTLEKNEMPRPYIIVAHSAGGHVTLRFLHDHPGRVDAAILSAPMVRIAGGMVLGFLGPKLASFMCAAGKASAYAPGHQAFKDGRWGWRKRLTHDDDRFKDEDYFIKGKDRKLAVGGVTYRWLLAAYRSCDILSEPGYSEAIEAPVLVLNAGQDSIVDRTAVQQFAERMPHGDHIVLKGSKHEILKETDSVRCRAYDAIIPFLDKVSPIS